MKRVIVQYKVKADKAGDNAEYVRKVFAELKQNAPAGLRYATFVQADGVSFVHIASVETSDGINPLSESAAFKAFQAGIRDRCEVPPAAVDIEEVGSYGFWGN